VATGISRDSVQGKGFAAVLVSNPFSHQNGDGDVNPNFVVKFERLETCTLDENCRELTSTTMIGDGDSPDTPISFQEDQGPRPPEVNRVRPQNLFPREQIIGRRLSARLYEQLLNHQHQSLDEPRPIPTPPEVKRSFQ